MLPLPRRFFWPVVRLTTLCLGLTFAGSASTSHAETKPPGVRLSGVMLVSGVPRLAVVEMTDGTGHTVRPGETIPGVGDVAEITRDSIRLETPEGPRIVRLQSRGETPGSNKAPHDARSGADAAEGQSDEAETSVDVVTVTPDVLDAVERVAAMPGASADDLSRALIPLLDLSGDATVTPFFPGEPQAEKQGPARVNEALAHGEEVRLIVEEAGRERMIYLMPDRTPAGDAQDAGP